MIRQGIEKILELAGPKTLVINGRHYDDNHDPIPAPRIDSLVLETLSSLVSYAHSDLAKHVGIASSNHLRVHIKSHDTVRLITDANVDGARQVPAFASTTFEPYPFDQWVSSEDFMLYLKTKFVETPDLEFICKLISTIKLSKEDEIKDNGVSQTVSCKSGVHLVQDKPIPKTVTLRPYRTFMEIEQPASEFILRVRDSGGAQFKLVDADADMWKLVAKASILEHLAELKLGVPVLL